MVMMMTRCLVRLRQQALAEAEARGGERAEAEARDGEKALVEAEARAGEGAAEVEAGRMPPGTILTRNTKRSRSRQKRIRTR